MHMVRLLVSLLLLTASAAHACSVPVFRYALEHWPADPFQITVFHRGTMSDAQRAMIPADKLANAKVRTVDLATETADDVLDLWRQQKTETLPWVLVRFPQVTGITAPVIAGPLAEMAPHLFESAVRKEVIERLAAGESAVWVLLESGDKAKDDAAAALVEKRLEYLMGVMTLPKLDEQDIVNGLVSIAEEDLRLEFSILRVSRDDPGEKAFVRMLLTTEPDLGSLREPMVFPIFGRGRALYALVGAGIRHETIEEAASFLIGKCSCQIKERNPGVDLLLNADWTTLIKTPPDLARQLPTLAEVSSAAPVSVTATPKAAEAAAPNSERSPLWLLAIVYGVSPLFLGLAIILLLKAKRRR